MKKIFPNVLLSILAISLSVSFVCAEVEVHDEADVLHSQVSLPSLSDAHFLFMDENEGVEIEKEALGNNFYQYKIDIDSNNRGVHRFSIKDVLNHVIVNEEEGIDFGLNGTYTLTTKTDGYDLTYSLQFANNISFNEPYCHIFNSKHENGDVWPGIKMHKLDLKDDDKDVYEATFDAKEYASSDTKVVFSDNGNEKTIDLQLSNVTISHVRFSGQIQNSRTYYLYFNESNYNWGEGNAKIVAYHFGDGVQDKWEVMSAGSLNNGTRLYVGYTSFSGAYTGVIFLRYNPGQALDGAYGSPFIGNGWPGDNGVYNRTGDITIKPYQMANFVLNGWNSGYCAGLTNATFKTI